MLATGFSASAEEALRDGYIVLRKPYGRDELAEALRKVLEGQELGCARGGAGEVARLTASSVQAARHVPAFASLKPGYGVIASSRLASALSCHLRASAAASSHVGA